VQNGAAVLQGVFLEAPTLPVVLSIALLFEVLGSARFFREIPVDLRRDSPPDRAYERYGFLKQISANIELYPSGDSSSLLAFARDIAIGGTGLASPTPLCFANGEEFTAGKSVLLRLFPGEPEVAGLDANESRRLLSTLASLRYQKAMGNGPRQICGFEHKERGPTAVRRDRRLLKLLSSEGLIRD
jgi:hypothetical protein